MGLNPRGLRHESLQNEWGQPRETTRNGVTMRDYVFALTAGQPIKRDIPGDWFHVISAADPITITFNDGDSLEREAGMGGSADYQTVSILSATTQTVKVSLGYGEVADARATVNATVNTTVEPGNINAAVLDVSIGAGLSAVVAAADATRKAVIISLDPDQPEEGIRLADASVAANKGVWLGPGASIEIPTEAAVYAHNLSSTTAVVVNQLPVTRV